MQMPNEEIWSTYYIGHREDRATLKLPVRMAGITIIVIMKLQSGQVNYCRFFSMGTSELMTEIASYIPLALSLNVLGPV
jgi:hypothetical protein